MAYYRSYRSKTDAKEAASRIRKPGNTPHGHKYPISVTVQPLNNMSNKRIWGVYYYQR